MKNVNTAVIAGNLTRDAELKYTKNSYAICEFSVACNDSRKNANGEYEDAASFFDCTLLGKRAEALTKYLVKGQSVVVQGRLEQQRWEKDGQKRSKVVIIANEIELTGGKKNAESKGSSDGFSDDVPF